MLKILRTILQILTGHPASYESAEKDPLLDKINALTEVQRKALVSILIAIEELDWDCSIISNEDLKKMLNDPRINLQKINPYAKSTAKNMSEPKGLKKLDDTHKDQLKKMLSEMGINDIDDIEMDFVYYDEEDGIFYPEPGTIPNPWMDSPINNSHIKMHERERNLPAPIGAILSKEELIRDSMDSVFNFAMLYIYGSKKNNVATYFSLDSDKRLFVHDQETFHIENATQALDMCNDIIETHELDRIFLVETIQSKKLLPYLQRGIKNPEVLIELIPESYSFKRSIQKVVPLMSSGLVFVNNGPWLPSFQNELGAFFQSMHMPNSVQSDSNTSKLKSFVYGVNVWMERKETEDLVRTYGIENDND